MQLSTTTIPVYDVGGSHTSGTRTAVSLYFMLTARAHNFLYLRPELEAPSAALKPSTRLEPMLYAPGCLILPRRAQSGNQG